METKHKIAAGVSLLTLICASYIPFLPKKQFSFKNVFVQTDSYSCGYCCLRMIFEYYDIKKIDYTKMRSQLASNRKGTSMLNLKRYSNTAGLKAKGLNVPNLEQLDSYTPCIIRINSNHFVVVDSMKNGFIYVRDPLEGNVMFKKHELPSKWDNVVLVFQK